MLLHAVVAPDVCARWLDLAERRYAAVDRSRNDPEFALHSSSLRLRALEGIGIDDVLREVMRGELPGRLGPLTACDVDQCWIRRQYAPEQSPPHHAPHSWHQDGALNFDFVAHAGAPVPAGAMLDMLTCWIPLTPCGVEAPGLEWVRERIDHLLAPAELSAERILDRYPPESFERPAMNPGDALLLRGDTLHRTHVTPAMTRERTSIELRFFRAQPPPERLRDDRFVFLLGG